MRRLLKEDPELVHARGPQGETPLHDAMNIEIVRLLLEYGADIEAVDTTYGNTPAEFGIWNRSATSYLIERGAKVSFDLACHLNDAIRVRAYLETDPSLLNVHSGPKRPEARTLPIRAAATAGALEVIEVLIEFGADINTRDEQGDGETPLHAAARRGYRELVTFLLERGADPDIRTISGLKPSHYAEDGKRRGWQAAIGIAEHDAVIALLKDHEAA
jgi:ankyrin repeat protein